MWGRREITVTWEREMRMWTLLAVVLCATFVGCTESAAPPAVTHVVAIVGARLIDGTGAEPITDAVVVIEDGRILTAGSRSSINVPDGAEIINGVGKTIIPGLVETHAHYHGDLARVEAQYKKQLYFGVTTSRSIGSDPADKVAKALEARAGAIPGPRMYTAGLGFSFPEGFPPGLPVNRPSTEDEARLLVHDLADQGVHFVKMWVNAMPDPGFKITAEMQSVIVAEAMALDLIPVAHINEETDLRQLVDIGVRDFLHTAQDSDLGPEFLEMCRTAGVTFSPTLTNIEAGWYWVEHPDDLKDPEIQAAFEPEAFTRWSDPAVREEAAVAPNLTSRKARLTGAMTFVKTVVDAGIPVAVGTDSGSSSWNVPMGWGTHRELQLYVEAGLTPMQAIVAATRTGAELLAQGDADYGTVQPGMVADFVVLDANPLADIHNTLAIDRVMQGGKWLDRDALMPMP